MAANPGLERVRAGAILQVERVRNEVGQLDEKIRDVQGRIAVLNKRLRRLVELRSGAADRLAVANDRVGEMNQQLSEAGGGNGSIN